MMDDYKKKIIEGVLSNPMYREAAADLPQDQKDNIEKVLSEFVDSFSMNLIKTLSVAATKTDAQKSLDIPSGSVIISEHGG